MVRSAPCPILQMIRRVVNDPRIKEFPDQELLCRFGSVHDEAAFDVLLRRHGPMVLNVCRNVLSNQEDAEDAFQATFLILARKAWTIRKRASVGSWLYGVAYRTALKARVESARRKKHEAVVPDQTSSEASDELTWHEAQQVLHSELSRLSEHYRAPLVLCYFEGKTQEEAAKLLGLSKATLRKYLDRGRALLRLRLARRGLGPAALLLASSWPAAATAAGVTGSLACSTIKAATSVAVGGTAAASSLVSPKVALLTEGVLKTMLLTRLKVTTALLVAVSFFASGLGLLILHPAAVPHVQAAQAAPIPAQKQTEAPSHKGWKALDGHNEAVRHVTFAPSGKLLATSSTDGTAKLWDPVSGKQVAVLKGHEGIVWQSAFAPDGETIATASADKTVRLWDLTGKELMRFEGHDRGVYSVIFAPDGKHLITGDGDREGGEVKIWDIATGKERAAVRDFNGPIRRLALTRDGKTLITDTSDNHFKVCKVWEWDGKGQPQERYTISAGKKQGAVGDMALSPDGKTLLVAADGTVKLYDVANGKERDIQLEKGQGYSVAFAPDGNTVVAGQIIPERDGNFIVSKRSRIRVWDAVTGKLRETLDFDEVVSVIGFSPDSKTLVAGSMNRSKSPGVAGQVVTANDIEEEKRGAVKLWRMGVPAGSPK